MVKTVLVLKGLYTPVLFKTGGDDSHIGVCHSLAVCDVDHPVGESAQEVPFAVLKHPDGAPGSFYGGIV